MIDVLVFVYENYWHGEPYPEPLHLKSKLKSVGFDDEEISQALHWLDELKLATTGLRPEPAGVARQPVVPAHPGYANLAPSPRSMRIYTSGEQDRLGPQCQGFIAFLETAGGLPAPLREIVLERVMAAGPGPMSLDDLKVIILMVYWSLGVEPDALVLDELCESTLGRVAH